MVEVSRIRARRRRTAGIAPPLRGYAAAVPRRVTALAVLAAALVLAPGGPAAARDAPPASKLLWGTVNICDTAEHPDTIGIRGSMPGTGRAGDQMFMRFRVQYYDQKALMWHNIGLTGDSGFVAVGSAKYRQRQTGRNFTVRPPRAGAFILRGAVSFEWRRDGEVVRTAKARTTAKRGRTKGADPAGFSAATCSVKA